MKIININEKIKTLTRINNEKLIKNHLINNIHYITFI